MKKLILVLLILSDFDLFAQKPILPDFQADPTARVFGDTMWIYPSHDVAGSKGWDMVDWHCFSSTDLKNWTDHGVIFGLKDLTWASKYAWAPDCIGRNGKYYFYFPADFQIGVAVGESPAGPFKDALGKPLIAKNEGGTAAMDPCVFIDDDGQAYLYYGQNSLCVVKLKDDMITKDGEIKNIPLKNFHEGIWMHKKDGLYYLSYPSNKGDMVANLLEYSIGKTPYGPFEYKGIIMDNRSRNVHHSIVKFKNKWYLFYHVQGPSPYERKVCAEYLEYNPDGTIKPLKMTKNGVIPVKRFKCASDIYQTDMVFKEYYVHSRNIDDNLKIDISYLNGSEKLPNSPVVYITDGYWRRFDHKYIHYLTRKKVIPPVIVVGIGYPKNYDYEKTRTRDLSESPENFRQCIIKEIIPFVEKNYSCDPHRRILYGASRGGHYTIYSLFHDAADSNNVFSGYIGASPFLPDSDAVKLYEFEKILFGNRKSIQSKLFLSYGELEGYDFMIGPDEKMFRLLDARNYKGLEFIHYVYPGKNHYTNTRPTMVDGIRLLMADSVNRGIGFEDFPQNTLFYHFKNSTEVYDWNYSLEKKQWAIQNLSFAPAKSSEPDGSGSLKAVCHFAGSDSGIANIGTCFDHLENFTGKIISVKIYIPRDLARMNCTVKAYFSSTDDWIYDEQIPIGLQAGWNDIRWDLSSAQIKGKLGEVRQFGWIINHPDEEPAWNGNIYYDEIRW